MGVLESFKLSDSEIMADVIPIRAHSGVEHKTAVSHEVLEQQLCRVSFLVKPLDLSFQSFGGKLKWNISSANNPLCKM